MVTLSNAPNLNHLDLQVQPDRHLAVVDITVKGAMRSSAG